MSQTELDLLLEEIHEQPGVTQRLLTNQTQAVRDVARTIRQRQPSTIVLDRDFNIRMTLVRGSHVRD